MAALTQIAAKLLILPAVLFLLLVPPPLTVIECATKQIDPQTVEIIGKVGEGEWSAIVDNIEGQGRLRKITITVKHPDGDTTHVSAEYDPNPAPQDVLAQFVANKASAKTPWGMNALKAVYSHLTGRGIRGR